MSKANRFTYAPAQLEEFAQTVLDAAKRAGASACECEVSEGHGLSVTVRKDEPETIEHNRDKGIGITVYFGERPNARRGHASTSDFSAAALTSAVEAAAAIARKTAVDDCAGPPERDELARERARTWTCYHPWSLGTEEAIRIARRTERAAFALSPKIRNSEGATRLGAAGAVRVRQQPRLHARLPDLAAHAVALGDRRGPRPDAARRLVQRRARARRARRSRGARPLRRPRARWRGWVRARSPPARRRCCSRRRSRRA